MYCWKTWWNCCKRYIWKFSWHCFRLNNLNICKSSTIWTLTMMIHEIIFYSSNIFPQQKYLPMITNTHFFYVVCFIKCLYKVERVSIYWAFVSWVVNVYAILETLNSVFVSKCHHNVLSYVQSKRVYLYVLWNASKCNAVMPRIPRCRTDIYSCPCGSQLVLSFTCNCNLMSVDNCIPMNLL